MTRVSKDPETRKNEILDVAERLFEKKGFENTPVSDIVEEVGVAKGTFYYYFASKESIIIAILERRFKQVEEKIKITVNAEELTPLNKMEVILETLILASGNKDDNGREYSLDQNVKIHQQRDALFFERFEPYVEKVIKAGVEKGIFRVTNIEGVSKILFLGIDRYIHKIRKDLAAGQSFNELLRPVIEVIEKVLGLESGKLQNRKRTLGFLAEYD